GCLVGAEALTRAAEVVADGGRATFREQLRVGAADPAAGAGADSHPALEAQPGHRLYRPVTMLSLVPQYRRSRCRELQPVTSLSAARSGRLAGTRSSTRRRACSHARATTPPASPSCARSTVSARARSTTTSSRRRGCSPRSTTG